MVWVGRSNGSGHRHVVGEGASGEITCISNARKLNWDLKKVELSASYDADADEIRRIFATRKLE
jgi:hypothetical protein